MAQIGDQSGQQSLHIFAFPIPQVEATDSSAMAQIMDPRLAIRTVFDACPGDGLAKRLAYVRIR